MRHLPRRREAPSRQAPLPRATRLEALPKLPGRSWPPIRPTLHCNGRKTKTPQLAASQRLRHDYETGNSKLLIQGGDREAFMRRIFSAALGAVMMVAERTAEVRRS